ncbi:hypothetical protein LCGC14_2495850 [marine sediment metagenome]|uniref:Uncharacterized protein n=1 Tax=marine sediment metagenome TaxID=412755 RepID=A0A0F9DF41_9ZZZZ
MKLQMGVGQYRVVLHVGSTLVHIHEDMGYARIGLVAEITIVRSMMCSVDIILGIICLSVSVFNETLPEEYT